VRYDILKAAVATENTKITNGFLDQDLCALRVLCGKFVFVFFVALGRLTLR